MERIAFLLETTGERISALLNPNTLVVRRRAGVRSRRAAGGQLAGAGLSDDPILYTGGGQTELELDLLFDVAISGSTTVVKDVRDLTLPLWNLSENAVAEDGYGKPPLVRFLWGKAWNVRGVIAALAERLEEFSAEGAAQRSWMRMRLLRVNEPGWTPPVPRPFEELPPASAPVSPEGIVVPPESVLVYQTKGRGETDAGGGTGGSGERLDEIAAKTYGDPALWRLVASFNNLDDPSSIPPGTVLQLPPPSSLGRTG
jgi:hypothetical protein